MNGTTRRVWSLAVALLLVVGVVAVMPLSGSADGNNANAKLCQKGGWQNYQGSDETRFASEEACVSYGAHGGTLIPLAPSIGLRFAPTSNPNYCAVIEDLSDLDPSTQYVVEFWVDLSSAGTPFLWISSTITTDAAGDAVYTSFPYVLLKESLRWPGGDIHWLQTTHHGQVLSSVHTVVEC